MKTLKELNLTRQEAEKFIIKNICGICGDGLGVAWGGSFGYSEYIIRCGTNVDHSQFGRRKSLKEEMTEKMANEQVSAQPGNRALAKVPSAIQPLMNKLVLNQQEAITILRTLWNKAPDIEIKKAAAICALYRLNPLMKHLFLIPYEKKDKDGNIIETTWATVLGISATRLMASRKHRYSYMDGPRIMTEKERLNTFGEYDEIILAVIVRLKNDAGMEAPGYGFWPKTITYYDKYKKAEVTKPNEPKGTDKGNTMFNMASNRAERLAFGRLCPQDLPGAEIEVIDEQYQDLPALEQNGHIVEGEIVNQETGEIKSEKDTASATETPAGAKPEGEKPPEKGKYPEDWRPKNAGELLQYALDEKGLSKGMVMTEILVIGNSKDIEIERDWPKIKAAKKFEAVN